MDAAAALEHSEVVGAAPPRRELVPALPGVAEVRVRVDEARHHHGTLGVNDARRARELERLPRIALAGRHDDAVARGDPAAVDRADVARRGAGARMLVLQRRERQDAATSDDEVGLGHPFSTIFQ